MPYEEGTAVVKESAIQKELNRTTDLLDSLGKEIKNLSDKIMPVLSPGLDSEAPLTETGKVERANSPLVENIGTRNMEIEKLITKVLILKERVEL